MATIKGQEFQHATIDLQVAGDMGSVTIRTFGRLEYKIGAEKKPVYRADGKTVGYTIDNEKLSGSISMLQSEWKALKERVATAYPTLGIGQIEFDWTVTYGNNIATLMTDKLRGVMFNEEPRSSQSNQDALMVDIPLFISEVEPHGGAFIKYAS